MPSLNLCCCVQTMRKSFFGTARSAELSIALDGPEGRPTEEWKTDAGLDKLFVYLDGESIAGKIGVTLRKPGSKLEHRGIRIELIGEIETRGPPEKPNRREPEKPTRHEFFRDVHDLISAGELQRNASYDFQLPGTKKKPYESYAGIHARLRRNDISAEQEVIIFVPSLLPEVTRNVKTEIGIGDTLHIELECNKWKYHLSDVINGTIHFIKLEVELSSVELQIIRKEIAIAGHSSLTENEIIASFEILDGTPKTGDCLPIRLLLCNYRLTPTMRNVESRFTAKYYLNFVIMDNQENKYFKQQELTLYRKDDRTRVAVSTAASHWKKHHKDQAPTPPPPPHPPPSFAGADEEAAEEAEEAIEESSVELKLENATNGAPE